MGGFGRRKKDEVPKENVVPLVSRLNNLAGYDFGHAKEDIKENNTKESEFESQLLPQQNNISVDNNTLTTERREECKLRTEQGGTESFNISSSNELLGSS